MNVLHSQIKETEKIAVVDGEHIRSDVMAATAFNCKSIAELMRSKIELYKLFKKPQ